MFEYYTSIIAMVPQGGQGGQGGGGLVSMLIMFGAIILIMYFLMIRPQQKRTKEHQKMLDSVKRGDKVITTAGIHGTVTNIEDGVYEIQIADNTKVRFEKNSIANKKQ